MIDFRGQVAIVTGSGRGIGRAHALEFGRRGAAVVVNDLDAEVADSVVGEIQSTGGTACASYDSVSTEVGGERLVQRALSEFGTVDVLVNNAGLRRPGFFGDLSTDEIDVVLDSHLRAAFFVSQPAWRIMRQKRYGRIVMTSSSSGMFSNQGLSNYAAAKAGIYGLTKAMAYEGQEFGITTNCVLPFAATRLPGAPVRVPRMAEERAKYISDEVLAKVPANRSDPALVAHMVAFLASRECELTGEAFSVCNGRYARVFVGVAEGWLAPDVEAVSAERIQDELAVIRDLSRTEVPMWIFEESASVTRRVVAGLC